MNVVVDVRLDPPSSSWHNRRKWQFKQRYKELNLEVYLEVYMQENTLYRLFYI